MFAKFTHKHSLIWFVFFIVISLGLASCTQNQTAKPKYIFYFIGDGMGHAQVNATEAYLASMQDKIANKQLVMNQFTLLSSISTFSHNKYITDSAAAGTALASGVKTNNGCIGVDETLTQKHPSVAVTAKKRGMKVGIISTVMLNHATPAAFYAHQESRRQYYEIAMQLPNYGFDFFAGGDLKDAKGKKGDQPSAIENAIQAGYRYVRTNAEILNLRPSDEKIIAVPEECPEGREMPYCIDKKKGDLKLAQLVAKGIELLDNPDGFFMMCEGGKIDWAGHSNDVASMVQETQDFDDAVATAYEFYKKHPEETLIIVTADHETGGLTLGSDHNGYDSYFHKVKHIKSSIDKAYEGIADLFKATTSIQEIRTKLLANYGLNVPEIKLDAEDYKKLDTALKLHRQHLQGKASAKNYGAASVKLAIEQLVTKITGFGWTTHAHTGILVPLKVVGAGVQEFEGYLDNTQVAHKINKLLN